MLSISVVVPLQEHRKEFFYNECLPSIEKNNPSEIIIIEDDGKAPYKRNLGLDKIKPYDYTLFSDDDIIYPVDWMKKMIDNIKDNDNIAFSYSGYRLKGHGKLINEPRFNFLFNSRPFDLNALKNGNYISTMSLIKSKYLIRWDENEIMYRYQDWEYYLRMCLKYNKKGKLLNYPFVANYFEDSLKRNWPENVNYIVSSYIKQKLLIDKKYD